MPRIWTGAASRESLSPANTGLGGWSGWAFVPGICFVIIGVLAIAEPLLAGLAVGLYFAAMLMVVGAFTLIAGLANTRMHGAWLAVLLGLLSIAVGVFILYNPVAGAASLVWAMGLWLVIGGLLELGVAFSLRHGRGWLLFIALVDLALGGLLFLMDPAQALFLSGFFVGASLLYRGLWSLFFTAGTHRLMARSEAGAL